MYEAIHTYSKVVYIKSKIHFFFFIEKSDETQIDYGIRVGKREILEEVEICTDIVSPHGQADEAMSNITLHPKHGPKMSETGANKRSSSCRVCNKR